MNDFPDKTIVVADQQTNGRGKGSNRWLSSNTNNLYMSILIKESAINIDYLPCLTQYMAVIAAEKIDQMNPYSSHKTAIKWPNDLIFNGKKIGGILAEACFVGSKLMGVVLGIGINFDLSETEKAQINQPSSSLSAIFPNVPNKTKWTESLLQSFFDQYEEFLFFGKSMFENKLAQKLVNSQS